jgi:hypothetical protein
LRIEEIKEKESLLWGINAFEIIWNLNQSWFQILKNIIVPGCTPSTKAR